MSLPSYSVKGRGRVRVGGLEPLTSCTMLFSVTYLCLSLTAILLVFCFSFLFVFLMNKLLLSYLLYPFAQLARAENTIIFFRLPFGWFFMKTFFLQFVCLFVLHELYVCSVCKIMRSWCIACANHAETKRYFRSRVHMKHHQNQYGIFRFAQSPQLLSLSGSARVFGYTVYRGFLNRVYGILQLKYGYSVYHFLRISGIKYNWV